MQCIELILATTARISMQNCDDRDIQHVGGWHWCRWRLIAIQRSGLLERVRVFLIIGDDMLLLKQIDCLYRMWWRHDDDAHQ
jgi:hypothetical protein